MADEEDLSSTSFASSISLASSIHQPKPPGGPKPSSQGFSRSRVAGKVVRSPYISTSTPAKKPRLHSARGSHHHGARSGGVNRRSVPMASPVPVAWTSPPSRAGVPRPSVSGFLQSLMKTPGFSAMAAPYGVRRRTSNKPHPSPALRSKPPSAGVALSDLSVSGDLDAIQLRDLLVQYKRDMNVLRKERDGAKAQQVRLSKELMKKDKEIEDLMSKGHISTRDATRSLANTSTLDKSSASSAQPRGGVALVSSLRQQVHTLERALREREGEVTGLRSSVGVSRVKEAELMAETYYREICRLKQMVGSSDGGSEVSMLPRTSESLMNSPRQRGASTVSNLDYAEYRPKDIIKSGRSSIVLPHTLKEARVKLRASQQTIGSMATEIDTLELENKTLRERIEMSETMINSMTNSPSNLIGQHGAITDRYEDYTRAQMLSALAQLEMRSVELGKKLDSAHEDKDKARVLYERRITELREQTTRAENRTVDLENKLAGCQDNVEKLKSVIRRLKDDRTHYRQTSENTQSELEVLQERLGKEEMSREEVAKELQSVREDYHNEMVAIQHSRKLARKQSSLLNVSKDRRDQAASTIQSNWRRRQATKKQHRYQRETEQAIVDLQSTFKAHLARKKAFSAQNIDPSPSHSLPGDPSPSHPLPGASAKLESEAGGEGDSCSGADDEESVELIQAALRGYLTRQMALQDFKQKRDATGDTSERSSDRDTTDFAKPTSGGVSGGRGNTPTSSLVSYTPPTPSLRYQPGSDLMTSRAADSSGKRNRHHSSPWGLVGQRRGAYAHSDSDEDYQHVRSRSYLSTSTESPPQDPDKCLLMDEL